MCELCFGTNDQKIIPFNKYEEKRKWERKKNITAAKTN